MKIVFILDTPSENKTAQAIYDEHERNHDMVLLPTKSQGKGVKFGRKLWEWLKFSKKNYKSRMYAKADSDVFICVDELMEKLRLKYLQNSERMYLGLRLVPNHLVASTISRDVRLDEFFVILGSQLVEDLLKLDFHYDTNYGGTSLGMWIQNLVKHNGPESVRPVHAPELFKVDGLEQMPSNQLCKYRCVYHGNYFKASFLSLLLINCPPTALLSVPMMSFLHHF